MSKVFRYREREIMGLGLGKAWTLELEFGTRLADYDVIIEKYKSKLQK